MKVSIWSDGSCYPTNGGPGGWAAILVSGDRRKEIHGGIESTTISRMELMAVIQALKSLRHGPHDVIITTDSQYCMKAITGIKKVRANHDLINELTALCAQHSVRVIWERGHIGQLENERCDQLAMQERLAHTANPGSKGESK